MRGTNRLLRCFIDCQSKFIGLRRQSFRRGNRGPAKHRGRCWMNFLCRCFVQVLLGEKCLLIKVASCSLKFSHYISSSPAIMMLWLVVLNLALVNVDEDCFYLLPKAVNCNHCSACKQRMHIRNELIKANLQLFLYFPYSSSVNLALYHVTHSNMKL